MAVIDLSDWKPDIPEREGVLLCEQLELVELAMHGHDEYCRITQKGINVMYALMLLARMSAEPENQMKKS